MQQRFTTHVTTGVGVPSSLEEQSYELVPQLGRALFAGAAKAASALAKREVSRVLRHVRANPDKESKRQVADWFVVETLLDSLATEAAQAAPAQLRPLARTRLRADDGWGAFAVLGAWQLRECGTTRVAPQNMLPSPRIAARKLSRKRSRVTRKAILTLVNAYEGSRRPPLGTFAEHQTNDPLAKFRKAVTQIIANHKGAQAKAFPRLVRADIDGSAWPSHSSFFLNIPFESRLGLTLSMLLRLRADHTVWTHRLEFVIEPLLRSIVREARRNELARQFKMLPPADLTKLAAAVSATCAYGTEMDISTALSVGTTSVVIPSALQAAVNTAANAHVQLNANDILALVTVNDATAFDAASKTLSKKWTVAIVGELRKQGAASLERLDFVEATTEGASTTDDGDKMLNVLLASLPPEIESSVLGAGSDPASLASAVTAEVPKHFGAPPTWTVALPIENWVLSTAKASAATSGALMTIGELEDQWKPSAELAPAPDSRLRSRLSKATICLVATGIRAPDAQLAVREAQSRLDATLCGIWFLNARPFRAQLATNAFARRELDGQVIGVGIERSHLFPTRSVEGVEVSMLVEVAADLTTRWNEPHQRDMWRRVSEGMGFLRSAFSATLFYERYLFLWMALEALLNKLAIDKEEKYESVAPIGTRVAYRAALLLVPDAAMTGRTYGEARWVTTLELGALYHLRNKAVHEGRRNPPMDEILLERFQRRVVSVFETISHHAFRYGMRRIEELLAWCEDKFPETDPIP